MKVLNIALAGNANVGKSTLFNQLTGLHQHIGNWPGKTVEKAEGTLKFMDVTINVVDLPGIYSLSAFTIEERISREYIIFEKPDVVVNVVDACALERNLFFTLQLLEMEVPVVVALNQVDLAKKKGIEVNAKKLEDLLGVPVVPTVAVRGEGLSQLLKTVIETKGKKPTPPRYGSEIENAVERLEGRIRPLNLEYPTRWLSIKLLEGDEEIRRVIEKIDSGIVREAEELREKLEKIHGEPIELLVNSERYALAGRIAREVQSFHQVKETLASRLERFTIVPPAAYLTLLLVMVLIFSTVFLVGGWLAGAFDSLYDKVGGFHWLPRSLLESTIAAGAVVLPYVVPFYLLLHSLEDSGYLPRAAFLMDGLMHRIGLHGKAFIPVMLGFGCDVPACLACRVMETERDKILAAFVVTMIPCAATSVVILGTVGRFLGLHVALALYALHFLIVILIGRLLFKMLPGEPVGLIMELPPYRTPHLGTVLKQTWSRTLEFLKIAMPLIAAGGLTLSFMAEMGWLETVDEFLKPVTSGWLGLPKMAGIVLVFGILRKEMILILLASLLGTTEFSSYFTPTQMVILGLVSMLYLPCVSTYAAMVRETGWRRATLFTLFRISFAILIGGVVYRILCFLV